MGVQLLLLLGLGCHSKQAGDEGDLPADVSFAHPSDLSLAHYVYGFISLQGSLSMEKKPIPGLTSRFRK